MAREQVDPELSLVPTLDVLETKVKSIAMVAKATTLQTGGAIADPSKGLGDDSNDINIEEDNTIICSTKSSHMDFRKSKIKGGHIEVLTKFDYIDNVEWVWTGAMI
jgi:hypothetical protein